MVAEQGETVNKIEKATENAALDVEEGTVQIKQVIYNLYNPINSRSKIAFLTISSQATAFIRNKNPPPLFVIGLNLYTIEYIFY